jgi:hypothetical protein
MTDETDSETDEMNHTLRESTDKIRVNTQVKRGTATRDQDTHDLKVRGETPEQAAERMETLVAELRKRDVFQSVREIGNEDGEADNDE